jgi:hypothetical protein
MVVPDVVSDLVDEQKTEVALDILEDSCEALAASRFFWTFVTARFQLRRADQHSPDAPAVA